MIKLPLFLKALVGVAIIGGTIYFFTKPEEPKQAEQANNNQTTNTQSETPDPAGTIIVQASQGALNSTHSESSFISEAGNSGIITYLAYKGDSALYSFEVPKGGQYQMWAKLSDDGTWPNESRNATVIINPSVTSGGGATIQYKHFSKDTKGWVWTTLGNVTLNQGTNTVSFAKDADTGAAFSFQAFKFTPILLAQ